MLDKTSSIICAFGLASAALRSPYRHLELCGIALNLNKKTGHQSRYMLYQKWCPVMVRGTGLEPVTSCTSSRCSTSWANRACPCDLYTIPNPSRKSKPFFRKKWKNSENTWNWTHHRKRNLQMRKGFSLPHTRLCGILIQLNGDSAPFCRCGVSWIDSNTACK